MVDDEPSPDALRSAIELACVPQNASRIMAGRQRVLSLPRAWVVERIGQVAAEVLDLSDYWEYRRLLELAALPDERVLQRFVRLGLASRDPDVREAAQDFSG